VVNGKAIYEAACSAVEQVMERLGYPGRMYSVDEEIENELSQLEEEDI
jgi:hypothetical protein